MLCRFTPLAIILGLAVSTTPTQAQIAHSQVLKTVPLEIVDPGQTTLEALEPAIVNLQVTEPFSIMALPPVPNGFIDPSGTQHTGYVSHNNNEVPHGQNLQIMETSSVDIGVRMRVERPNAYPPGRYTYTVFLTVTPL